LRRSFTEEDLPYVGRVTASFGVTVFRPDDDLDSLFRRVDQALYRAKSNGRDRVEQG
jgi:PleD family two-component response regulator